MVLTMVTFMIAQSIRAVYASLRKERLMVREGGRPLPTSVWVFLGVELVTAPIVVYTLGSLLTTWFTSVSVTGTLATVFLVTQVAVCYMLAVFAGSVVSIMIAFIVKLFMVRAYNKKLKAKNEEAQAEWIANQIDKK